MSRLVGRLAKMPAPQTRDVAVDAITITMPDGVALAADRYYPKASPTGLPLLVTRTPYGRQLEGLVARLYAERGYQVLVVSCRGTFDSGGDWLPFQNERSDGQTVLAWVGEQPWFGGVVGLFGASYVGLTQWSVIDGAPEYVKAWAPTVTSSYFSDLFYPGGSFALESSLAWVDSLSRQEQGLGRALLSVPGQQKRITKAAAVLPLSDADQALVGERVEPFQIWLDSPVAGPWWEPVNFASARAAAPPASFTAGWYDVFLPHEVADFVALRAAGREARIAIGPWHHGSMGQAGLSMRNTLAWMDRYVGGRSSAAPAADRVQLQVMGTDKWLSFPEWPPPADSQRWHLHGGGRLAVDAPAASEPDTYRYDPADPTPGIGGPALLAANAGRKDNKVREARADVLLYTSEALADDVTIAGPVRAELFLRSSLDYTDFFVRLCDVDAKGRSTNLCDGILRLGPDHPRGADGTFALTVELWPTANTFARGHRIRLQVSSGAHPLYARNLGTSDPLGKGTDMVAADQEVFHDPQRPSAIVLPVLAEPVRP